MQSDRVYVYTRVCVYNNLIIYYTYKVQTVAILCFYPRSAIISGYTGRITAAFFRVGFTTVYGLDHPVFVYTTYYPAPFGRVHYEGKKIYIMENVHIAARTAIRKNKTLDDYFFSLRHVQTPPPPPQWRPPKSSIRRKSIRTTTTPRGHSLVMIYI